MTTEKTMDEQRDPQTYAIIGAAMAVHSELGCGFLEPLYQEALGIELQERGVFFAPQVKLHVTYRGKLLKTHYVADFVCFESVIVEIKSLSKLSGIEESQILNYLKATGHERGILINFGSQRLEYRRFIRSQSLSAPSASSADNV